MSFYKNFFCSILFLGTSVVNAQTLNTTSKEDVISAFNEKVKVATLSQEEDLEFQNQIQLNNPIEKFTHSQFFIAADRNPKKQNAALVFWDNDNQKIEVVGYSKVSTGSVRIKHFYTPLGWFENVTEHGSYRAEGTKNSKGIRGYGTKGMRVWDFGWVPSSSGIVKNLNIDIRFQMHATDPQFLESRLGKPDSQGCLRVHSTFNKFLDSYGIIDKNYEEVKYWALNKNRTPASEAGSWLLVFDTSKK